MSFTLLGILNSQAAGAGGGAAYDLLETTVLASSASSVSFTGLDAYTDYKHLQIRATVRRTTAANGLYSCFLRFNSDSGGNYADHFLEGTGSAVQSSGGGSRNRILIDGVGVGDTNTAGIYAGMVLDILDFSSTTKNTTTRTLAGVPTDTDKAIFLQSGLYNQTSAITSLEFGINADLQSGTRLSLYGIK